MLGPFGEELGARMQMVTAAITVALVHASGIPATIDGVFIDTPAGLFKVAEACSGVMFLVAMFAFGVLAAPVCCISWRRLIGVMALTPAVPVLPSAARSGATWFAAHYAVVRRSAGVRRAAGASGLRFVPPGRLAYGHHGRLAVSGGGHEALHQRDAPGGGRDLVRDDRDLAGVDHDARR